MKNYSILNETNYLLMKEKKKTFIFEGNNEISINKSVNSILLYNCRRFGNSLNEVQEDCKEILGTTYKTPVYLNVEKQIIFFPIHDVYNNYIYWINYNNIDKLELISKNETNIEFKNNTCLNIKSSVIKIKNEISLSERLNLFKFNNQN